MLIVLKFSRFIQKLGTAFPEFHSKNCEVLFFSELLCPVCLLAFMKILGYVIPLVTHTGNMGYLYNCVETDICRLQSEKSPKCLWVQCFSGPSDICPRTKFPGSFLRCFGRVYTFSRTLSHCVCSKSLGKLLGRRTTHPRFERI